ncbi:SH3 domain-containing protein [Sporolactobacillus spathodeae]|uniref:GH25 family lysozyme M1 (1,4-beta-N-acetylmuramidase)/uncharacterized protein YgiM (DUF1202 family) n=1 Tax=Sporolactobacillus spathodeae TaxID=1465502 RepID=A0ABS2Q7K5_9BACL|nr:GH25 family lysozyme M1 (1,4-beta-N-acetylmuramidase)/uncharacterized protein YgiM (DUF1202 family) [Sporolactobacillus spathodeae]
MKSFGKRLLFSFLLALLVILSIVSPSESTVQAKTSTYSAYVTAYTLKIRNRASTRFKTLRTLSMTNKVTVISKYRNYSRVKYGRTTGYVQTKYLSTRPYRYYSAYVTSYTLKMRNQPSIHYSLRHTLSMTNKVTVIGKGHKYALVKYGRTTGYVQNSYLSKSKYRAYSAYVTSYTLRMRSAASVHYSIRRILSMGSKVSVIGKGYKYALVTGYGQTGYVQNNYLSRTPYPMFTGYVTSNSLQVYGGPGTQYSKIITLHKSNSVTVSGKSGSWYKVKSGSREGYVSSVNISKKKPILTSVSLQMDLKPRSGSNFNHYQAYVIANALNVRTSPTSSANNVITSLKKNTVVTVIGETGNWLQISYNGGRVGFVSASYVIKGTAPKVAGDPKKPYTPPNSTISQLGIDVSHWNNNPQNRNNQNYTGSDINYQALKAAGIRFVIVKATEGQSYYDKTFAENVNKANAAGLATYAYHFFHAKSVTDAAKEADYFLKTINGRISKNSYVFLDVEDSVGDPLTKDKAQLTSYVNQFFKVLDSNGYHRFGIYTGYDFYYSRLIASELPNTTRLWIARYRGSATYNGLGMPADIWQYTDQGKLQGINANVDIDISYFTDAAGI